MDGDMINLLKVWLSVCVCVCYCYATAKFVPKGLTRLICFLPIVCIFLYLPLFISSIHLAGNTSFFVSWLANFKLLLFAFGKGPLASDPSISLARFVPLACLPIKIQQNKNPPPNPLAKHKKTPNPLAKHKKTTKNEGIQSLQKQNGQSKENPPADHQNKENPTPLDPKVGHKIPLNHVIKALLFGILLRAYDYSDRIPPYVVWVLYSLHIYLFLELVLAVAAALARTLLATELEPQFNEPYLSTSLQDFWGRRWNLMVTGILRPTVYEPTLGFSRRVLGRRWAPLPAVLATFVVSGLMHEIVFYHMGRMPPTWGLTCFFLLHGVCLTVEIGLKRAMSTGRWRLPRLVSGGLSVGFVMVTSFWLFLPQFFRFGAEIKAFEEYAALGEFFRNLFSPFVSRVG